MQNYIRKKKANKIFFWGVIFLFIGQLYSYNQARHLLEANYWLIHTDKVIEHVDNAKINISNSIRSLQNYLMSDNQLFEKEYRVKVNNAILEIMTIKKLTEDNITQQENLSILQSELNNQIIHNQNVIKIYHDKGKIASYNFLLLSENQNMLKKIDDMATEIKNVELSLFSHRDLIVSNLNKSTFFTVFILSCLTDVFMIILLVYIGIRDKHHFELQNQYNNSLIEKAKKSEEVSKLKGQFLSNMSHELRTPLNGILGFSELLGNEKIGKISADQKEYLEDIQSCATHLLRLINDILDLAKVEAGKMEFHPEKINLNTFIDEVLISFRYVILKNKLDVKTEIDPNLKEIDIDPLRLKQIFYNYLSNAIKFTPDGKKIIIRFRHVDEFYFLFEIEDTGIGISELNIEKLFNEFSQLNQDTGKKHEGTGIGLALTKQMVEAMHGKVGVKSILNKGSIFFAILPYRPILKA